VAIEFTIDVSASYLIEFLYFPVRDYHKSYYRPDNLCLIITGKVDHAKLLKVLEPVEANILSKPTPPAMKRPWVESGPVPKLAKTVEETVLFPDEDESMGEIMISWNGPDCHVS
jgi:Zn-dependent M16 (insulinase) family peptidase